MWLKDLNSCLVSDKKDMWQGADVRMCLGSVAGDQVTKRLIVWDNPAALATVESVQVQVGRSGDVVGLGRDIESCLPRSSPDGR